MYNANNLNRGIVAQGRAIGSGFKQIGQAAGKAYLKTTGAIGKIGADAAKNLGPSTLKVFAPGTTMPKKNKQDRGASLKKAFGNVMKK